MSNLYEYTYGRGGARTCAHSLAVRRWLATPKALPIGPEKKKKCSFALGRMAGTWTPFVGSSRAGVLIEYTPVDILSVW